MSNSSGSFNAPAAPVNGDAYFADDQAEDAVGGLDGLTEEDLRPDSPGWEDAEDDVEQSSIKCLACDESFTAVRDMVKHAKDAHTLDMDGIRKAHSTFPLHQWVSVNC